MTDPVNKLRYAVIADGLGWLIEHDGSDFPRWGPPIGAKLFSDQSEAIRTARETSGRVTTVLLKEGWP